MKRLTLFSIRSFAGPFVVTFVISMFMLIMQFLWKYIDDLMGKGLEVSVILELLVYASTGLIPLALPLAILLSSIMTFGNLAESNELTALKAAGLSLSRIMRPLTVVALMLSVATFYFANYVIPAADYKWHALIYDIQSTKVATLITPGSYSNELDGYAIKVREGGDNHFRGITIHDYTDPMITKTIKASEGEIYMSTNGKYLLFRLTNGRIAEELNAQPPVFQANGRTNRSGGSFRPSRRTRFEVATYKMELSGFQLNRSDQDMFKEEAEMLNVFQIQDARDSMQKEFSRSLAGMVTVMKNTHAYFQSQLYDPKKDPNETKLPAAEGTYSLKDLSKDEKVAAITSAISRLSAKDALIEGQKMGTENLLNRWDKFSIEFQRKFSLTSTIIVLFFVGAPLGAIVRKGGFGAPVVIAALLFMVYFILISVGESLATEQVLSPFWGMWMPTLVLSPIALLLLTSAANDLSVFDRKLWRLIFSLGRKR